MAAGRKFLFWAVAGALLLTAAAGVYFFVFFFHQKPVPLMQAVPTETVALFRPLGLKSIAPAPADRDKIVSHLSAVPLISQAVEELLEIDSLISLDEKISAIVQRNEALLALVPGSDSTVCLLVLLQVEDQMDARVLKKSITGHFTVSRQESADRKRKIYRVESHRAFYYCISNGFFAGSSSLETLELALVQSSRTSVAFARPEFREIMQAAGKNVDGNIYFDTRALLSLAMPAQATGGLQLASLPGDFASLDLVVKEDGLLLNGFFAQASSGEGLPGLFDGQAVVHSGSPSVLPSGTTEFFKLAFSNFDSLCCSLARLHDLESAQERVPAVSEFEKRHFTPWTTGEVTIATSGPGKQLAVFKVRENTDAIASLRGITDGKPAVFMGTEVFRIAREGMVRELLWPFTRDLAMPWYCLLDGQIVFASSDDFLRNVIRHFHSGKKLSNNSHYTAVSPHFTETAHLSYYCDLFRMSEAGGSPPPNVTAHFPAFTAQFSLSGKWLYASMFIAWQDSISDTGPFLWKVALDDEVIAGPWLVEDPATGVNLIFAADRQNKLYLLSEEGRLLFSRQLSGKPLGKVEYLGSEAGRFRYLLNTPGQVYLLDSAGQDAPGFPFRLEPEAAAGMLLLPGKGQKDRQIVIPCTDRIIYSYTLKPANLDKWKKPSLSKGAASEPLYFKDKQKEYLLFRDNEGGMLLTDGNGKEKKRYPSLAAGPEHSGIFLNRTNSKGTFIMTDNTGRLVYFGENGKPSYTVFGKFSPSHFFLYDDLNGKGGEDFIYVDQGAVRIFDRFKKELLNLPLPEPLAGFPVIGSIPGNARALFCRGESGIIYLIDYQGNIYFDEDITSHSGPIILKKSGEENFFLVLSTDNSVCLSPLP